ncbi:MAG: hypothetical protein US94_C0001G0070 [Berkelbacteria bacterium GW2011_GWB1_38_5]|uniref:Uncharacterized protein n=2 Tax=Candidatus Berkelbacteria TaxID=1618330 RepID=A0A0G0LIE2_9BACT|nr:MAG: hypothetical protein US94_C0001G0070 [Berkelbacteria bacterium GW2011_GWB1_38_5]KKQ90842.1 MAG: hypothetical protein UT15_C0003G0017 [Berkelbacteria bacterium GW2011_GWA1_39_10]
MRKKLIIIFVILIVVVAILALVDFFIKKTNNYQSISNQPKVNVATLKDGNETALGTISYPGAKTVVDISKAEQNKITLETTDSVNGAVNIYIQDLFNRYPNYKLTKQDITKTGALDNKGVLISLSGKTGALKITIWGTDKGMTDIEIIKDSNFK